MGTFTAPAFLHRLTLLTASSGTFTALVDTLTAPALLQHLTLLHSHGHLYSASTFAALDTPTASSGTFTALDTLTASRALLQRQHFYST